MSIKFPFVSRKKFDELSERLAKFETAAKPADDPTLDCPIPRSPFTGRITLETLRLAAHMDAMRRKNIPGSKPISVELQEAAMMGRRDAVGH